MKNTTLKVLITVILLCTPLVSKGQYWGIAGEMPYPVAGAEAVVIGSKIYIIGGYSEDLQAATDMIQQFDPYTQNWEVVGSMSAARVGLSAAVYNDIIYYFGGINDSSVFIDSFEQFNSVDNIPGNIDYENDSFNREYASGAVVGSKLYIFGGVPNQLYDSFQLPHLTIYDFDSTKIVKEIDTLFQTAETPSRQMSVAVDNDIYIFGGVSTTISNKIYKFDTLTDTLKRLDTDLQVPRAGGAAVYVKNSEVVAVYLIGGSLESESAINTVEVFDLSSDMLSSRYEETFITPRTDLMAVAFDDKIYLFGGYDANGNVVSQVEVLFTTSTTSSLEESLDIPDGFYLRQNYPNPFNPETLIRFDATKPGNYSLEVFSALGERVITLSDRYYSRGSYSINWDGLNELNNPVPSGTYFYRLSGAGKTIVKKMTLLR